MLVEFLDENDSFLLTPPLHTAELPVDVCFFVAELLPAVVLLDFRVC